MQGDTSKKFSQAGEIRRFNGNQEVFRARVAHANKRMFFFVHPCDSSYTSDDDVSSSGKILSTGLPKSRMFCDSRK